MSETRTNTTLSGGGPTSEAALQAGQFQIEGIEQGALDVTSAINQSIETLRGTQAEALQTLSPFVQTNTAAANELQSLLGIGGTPEEQAKARAALENSPGFQFRMQQGQQALERSAAARGGLFSGRTGQELQQFSQGLASTEFNNRVNQLGGAATLGQGIQTAAGLQSGTGQQVAGLQTQLGSTIGNAAVASAQARASAHTAANQEAIKQQTVAQQGLGPARLS